MSSASAHPRRARAIARLRLRMRRHPVLHAGYRATVGVVGTAIVVTGLILVPLPGPGWLIVFVGVALLGTEFRWARRVLRWGRAQVSRGAAVWKARRTRGSIGSP